MRKWPSSWRSSRLTGRMVCLDLALLNDLWRTAISVTLEYLNSLWKWRRRRLSCQFRQIRWLGLLPVNRTRFPSPSMRKGSQDATGLRPVQAIANRQKRQHGKRHTAHVHRHLPHKWRDRRSSVFGGARDAAPGAMATGASSSIYLLACHCVASKREATNAIRKASLSYGDGFRASLIVGMDNPFAAIFWRRRLSSRFFRRHALRLYRGPKTYCSRPENLPQKRAL